MGKQAEIITSYQYTVTNQLNHFNDIDDASIIEPPVSTAPHTKRVSTRQQQLVLGLKHLNTGAFIKALQAFDEVLAQQPNDLNALIYRHDTLVALDRLQEAFQYSEQLLTWVPYDARLLKRVATHRLQRRLVWDAAGRYTQQLLNKAVQLAPNAVEHHCALAYYHIFRGEWKAGVALLHEFAEQHPHHPRAWHDYARGLFHTGHVQAAAGAILKAHQLYQYDSEIYLAVSELLAFAGRLEELSGFITEMLERFADHWRVKMMAGRIYVEHFNAIHQGIALSTQALHQQAQLAQPWLLHGQTLLLAGQYAEAIEVLEYGWQQLPAQEGHSQATQIALYLGQCYQKRNEHTKCQLWWVQTAQLIEQLIALDPAQAYYWHGYLLMKLGERSKALQAYYTALNYHLLHPHHYQAKVAVKQLRIQ